MLTMLWQPGGWVIGVGLSDRYSGNFGFSRPTPVYWDISEERKQSPYRVYVFWRSFDRVYSILLNNIKKSFPTDPNVQATIEQSDT